MHAQSFNVQALGGGNPEDVEARKQAAEEAVQAHLEKEAEANAATQQADAPPTDTPPADAMPDTDTGSNDQADEPPADAMPDTDNGSNDSDLLD